MYEIDISFIFVKKFYMKFLFNILPGELLYVRGVKMGLLQSLRQVI
jgi:hypothetical protein